MIIDQRDNFLIHVYCFTFVRWFSSSYGLEFLQFDFTGLSNEQDNTILSWYFGWIHEVTARKYLTEKVIAW
jgi:hypothetical protein